MSQEKVKSLLDKINLLFNVFMKDGLEKISELEKDLLKEQINKLVAELDNIKFEPKTEALAPEVKEIVRPTAPPVAAVAKEEPVVEKPVEKVIEDVAETKVEEKFPTAEELMPKVEEKKAIPVAEINAKVFNDSKPLRNLKEVIDLNKSFIFKAELFDNSQDEYNSFINDLNALQTERESVKYLETIASRKVWDVESKVYELLLRSVEKRFLPLLQQ